MGVDLLLLVGRKALELLDEPLGGLGVVAASSNRAERVTNYFALRNNLHS